MRLHGSPFIPLLLFTLHLARISSLEHRRWQELSSTPPTQRALQRRVLRPPQFAVMDPTIKWSRQQSPPPGRRGNAEEPRMVDFHSGLWKLLGQISMSDFSQERNGLSKKFYDYYKGTNENYNVGISVGSPKKQKYSQQSISLEPSLRSDHLFDSIYNSELGNTKVKDLPPDILNALEQFGYIPEPQKEKTIVQIKTESHFYHTGPGNDKQGVTISPTRGNKPVYEYDDVNPEYAIFTTEHSKLADAYTSKPAQIQTSWAPPRTPNEIFQGQFHSVSHTDLPIKLSPDNKIKFADGASSVLEISSEAHPTKYFLSASYVNPLSPSGQVKPLPMDKLFNSELFTEDYKSLENEYASQVNDYTGENYNPQPPLVESPTAAVMNTVNKLDELFQTKNTFKLPENPMGENESIDSNETIVSDSEFFSQLESKLIALANHVDGLTLRNHSNANIKSPETVTAHIKTSQIERDEVSLPNTEISVPIPEHVSEMVKNISEIIGTNPSEDAMNAMIQHFSKVFQHAETILSHTFSDIPEYEDQTEPPVIFEPTQVPSLSILDSPRHVIIVYRPVLFVSHSNNSDWSKVVGEGYKPTVLNEHGETSEALTKEVLNTLGPNLLDSLKEHFTKQFSSELPASGTRKFSEAFSEQMVRKKDAFHIRGDYIVIDEEDDNAPFTERDTGEVSVHEDTEKESLAVDLIVPQNTVRIRAAQSNIPGDYEKVFSDHKINLESNIDSFPKIATSQEDNSKPAEYVHNVIVTEKSNTNKKDSSVPIAESIEHLKDINPAPWWLSNLSGENNGKKYVVRRIVKRRRKKPTKLRSKIFSRKPSQVELPSIERKSADQTQEQVRQQSDWKLSTQTPRLSEQSVTSVRGEEGRKNDDPPMIILEKPITDLPVERLADLVLKFYTSGT